MNTEELLTAIAQCRKFISPQQVRAMLHSIRGEERAHFVEKFTEYAGRFATMPETYGQDGLGDQAIVYLHYFHGGADWYITERDSDPDGEGQVQAFGLADLYGDGGELGYISILELIRAGVELDLYWKPCTLAQVRAKREARAKAAA